MEPVLLRNWQDSDLAGYAAMNCDPEVMKYFPRPLTHEESEASMNRLRALIDQQGWGLWAVEVAGGFAGFAGLAVPKFEAPFMPCVEIGWRLRREYWGRNIAYRAAQQALDFGFGTLNLPEIATFTASANARSRRLMERLQFVRDEANDFDHPNIAKGHPLRRHVLYRRKRPSEQSGLATCKYSPSQLAPSAK
jgi:RimJ/RimL family protein N-acetyltransferase